MIKYRKVRNCKCGPLWALYVNKRIAATRNTIEGIRREFWKAISEQNKSAGI